MTNPYRVLAVDDEEFNLLLLEACLPADRFWLTSCRDGQSALAEFKRGTFDVILLDILMEGIDGFEVRQLIRERNKKVPIIFLTSLLDDIDSSLVNRITADPYSYYMNKSFSKKMLLEKIEQVVATYREVDASDCLYRRIEDDLELAGGVQKILLPPWCGSSDQLLYSYCYEPNFKVSGDVFQVSRIDARHCFFLIGDIAGHGIQAALYMTALQAFLKLLLADLGRQVLRPHIIMNRINEFFRNDLHGENYMTCLIGIFDFSRNTLELHNAGHPGLLVCSPSDGSVREVNPERRGSIPIGWRGGNPYLESENVRFHFEDDDIFLGYTDGLFDLCRSEDERSLDQETFLKLFGSLGAQAHPASIPFQLRSALEQIGYQIAPDDVFIVAMQKRRGRTGSFVRYLQPRTSDVSRMVGEAAAFVQKETGNSDAATRCELLLSEFLNNIVLHGFEGARQTCAGILIEVRVRADRVLISVLDRGRQWGIDPKLQKRATAVLESLNDSRSVSGRGMPIILQIASTVSRKRYRSMNETDFTVKLSEEKAKSSVRK